MPDRSQEDGLFGGGGFDDDRLLAFALDLGGDAELEEAAAHDDGLQRRLARMRAEVAEIGTRVDAAVPAPDESYTDLSDGRWAGLHEYLAPGTRPPARARGASPGWLRVLAPVAAVVLALAVGLTYISRQPADTGTLREGAATDEAATPGLAGAGATKSATPLDGFGLIVLAEARSADGAFQRFAVVRTLKGQAPATVRLRVVERPAATGALVVLLLRPGGEASLEPETGVRTTATDAAAAFPELGALEPLTFGYRGAGAVALELPAGTDPATVRLP